MIATATEPRCLLGIDDLTADELGALLDLAAVMKRHPLAWRSTLAGGAIACVFEHAATRDRVSLEVAVHRLGALPVVLQPRGDSIADTARTLSAYCDAIAVHTGRHRDLLDLVEASSVPVVNALTDRAHPCQALADCLALRERFGTLGGLQIAYPGPREPAMRSLIEAATLSGMTVRLATAPPLLPDPALLARAGSAVRVCETPQEAMNGADVVFTAAGPRPPDATANLLPVEQAVLRTLVTGDWEA
ncbi:ornithine carbamoyltransferase [Solirubrobacter sp. CPCC 204708]|uniref:Ornithine carbamoyltransferase n=1 Tax=Solirubrobacter deserti TaxID=2282478 RepID=A0ABT4RPC7_9ACTN|nr:ornithine carbamoyltransferase [Solirubrobacter deserti]MBE2315712.1 ornithine carbamoyltransferase [Solirubrobacter deserti]MDA0140399.1 ornithine carbamoyltransferase [Solirubrobacter deserti]